MKITLKKIIFCAASCVVGLGTGLSAFASTEQALQMQKIETYVQEIQAFNEELAQTDVKNISATITITDNISYEQLDQYVSDNNLQITQLQARGIDLNGDRVTFASNTYKGLEESHRLLIELAQNNGIEFVGYNALYVLVDSDQIMDIQNDNLTFLLDTSSVKDSISRV